MTATLGSTPLRLSAYAPHSGPHVQDAAWWVALAGSLDLDRIWFGQQSSVSILGGVGYAAGRGHRAPIGTAVTLMPTTTPFASALELRALAQVSEAPVAAHFSPGYPHIQRALTGSPWTSPATATREFFTALRGLLAGGDVDVRGDYFDTTFTSPAPDVSDRIELGLGVLRPGFARVAGEVADGAVTWLASPDYVRTVLLPALTEGAEAARRRTPRLVTTLHAAVGVAADEAVDVVRVGVGPHLSAPHYRDMLARDGLHIDGELSPRHVREVIDRGLFVVGDAGDVRDRAQDLVSAGADEVSVVLHLPAGATRNDIRDVWSELAVNTRSTEAIGPGNAHGRSETRRAS